MAEAVHDSFDLEEALEAIADHGDDVTSEHHTLEVGAAHDLDAAYATSIDIRRRMQSELDALTNADVHVGARGRRLSTRHLPRVISGDPRVFTTTIEGIAPSTAVMLLEDVSGSMSGEPIRIASQALYASALALEGMEGIEVAAMAFPGNGQVLDFGQSPRGQQDQFQLRAWGGTPMGEAIQVAMYRLLQQPQARKLLIVLTDGEPNSNALALSMIAAAEQSGIEVFGVGILTDSVQRQFSRWIKIEDLYELPSKLVSLVRDEVMLSIAA
jgi:nitric oxide reductase activation protein